ncbi:hypothetical protein [Actinoplanes sp. N902-109]|nr:hypothetical protein [Actinoplanes sp. N902-109]
MRAPAAIRAREAILALRAQVLVNLCTEPSGGPTSPPLLLW